MELEKFMISSDTTIFEAMNVINMNAGKAAFLCEDGKLEGVVTDGDIRRHILKNGDLNEKVSVIANFKPIYLEYGSDVDSDEFMRKTTITCLPIVDKNKRMISIRLANGGRVYKNTNLNVPVVIMAGGKGTRLYPYTQILPKPLIPVGDQTITEHIMDKFSEFGCQKFHMIVNYKKNFIKAFFQDSEKKREVFFTEEKQFLGTGGGLRLLKDKIKETFFMTNCDILIEDDYSEMLAYHKENKNLITIVCAMKKETIPYGVIEMGEDGTLKEMREKPNFSFITNTGLYIIEPEFLDRIPENTFIHITDIIQNCLDRKERVGVYPISEHAWMDMGQMSELEKMRDRMENMDIR